jgi:RNA polymerase sigma-70 factor (ECF subfamily)
VFLEISEEQLVKGCLDGIQAFQQMLYKRYAAKMLTVCMRYANNRVEAEDVLQEGFILVFEKLAQFRMQGSFEGWIRKIMINKSLEHLRKVNKIYPVLDIDNVEDKFISEEDVLNLIDSKELLKMIQELPPMYKMVFNLFVFEGMGHKEIASTLGIVEGTSKSNLSDARNLLKKKIYKNLLIEEKTIYNERKANGE